MFVYQGIKTNVDIVLFYIKAITILLINNVKVCNIVVIKQNLIQHFKHYIQSCNLFLMNKIKIRIYKQFCNYKLCTLSGSADNVHRKRHVKN